MFPFTRVAFWVPIFDPQLSDHFAQATLEKTFLPEKLPRGSRSRHQRFRGSGWPRRGAVPLRWLAAGRSADAQVPSHRRCRA